jgi:hypothetical protein
VFQGLQPNARRATILSSVQSASLTEGKDLLESLDEDNVPFAAAPFAAYPMRHESCSVSG